MVERCGNGTGRLTLSEGREDLADNNRFLLLDTPATGPDVIIATL
ncbi:hypothetical protein [Sinorhizobium psoraleae]|uniref:Uncharacterized protein n=1 Tax=Sinorhizobium psoraleae TaxID=520838 RepID=A0ABT4KPQ7_9HYPH|nr:hypothetical protein [Sinorhizobium psoraleae]MCZ4093271.1 hypothetical protein [Sinorhizobium psoraleae]